MQEAAKSRFSERTILKVHELTDDIRRLLEDHFSDFWVEGEISDLRSPRSGHLYFTLKDAEAKISTVIFKSHMRFLRFPPKEGTHVLIRGHLGLYALRGEYQLICDYIEPKGVGALQAAFEALKEKLRLEGLFHADRKRPLPRLPSRVGIITSPTGAAIQDIIRVIRQADVNCSLLVYPVSVQGWSAAPQIVTALDEMNRYSRQNPHPIDVLILARGGGALEDLWAFNEEGVARAIARSKIPVISAVGHESDTTIADYAADLRAPTPSVAAEIVVQTWVGTEERCRVLNQRLDEQMSFQMETYKRRATMALRLLSSPGRRCEFFRNQIGHLLIRLQQSMHRLFEGRRDAVKKTQQGLDHLNPINRFKTLIQQHQQFHDRLIQEARRMVVLKKNRLQTEMVHLDLLSPLNILERGYSITQKLPVLSIVRAAAEVSVGDALKIKLHRGHVVCQVQSKETQDMEVKKRGGEGL